MKRQNGDLCSICGERPKPASKSRPDRLLSYCHLCNAKRTREYNAARPGLVFENNLKRYGIDANLYWALWRRQAGLCAICERPERQILYGKIRRLCVDHDARTGEVRGLLCCDCNTSIGKMGHAAWVLQSAIDYLERHSGSFSESVAVVAAA